MKIKMGKIKKTERGKTRETEGEGRKNSEG
jgi:hypothetical protein